MDNTLAVAVAVAVAAAAAAALCVTDLDGLARDLRTEEGEKGNSLKGMFGWGC
jgi:ferric-dicitrate binding protein FerR (iron transport regulator)